jgi:hypothetical protein
MRRVVRGGGLGIFRGKAVADDDLGPILLHAERLTESLAHAHVARIVGERARTIPARQPTADRAARTARLVAERNRRAIALDDGSVFKRIAQWRRERDGAAERD